jgi:murein DD-endopeptidase MepM/ murein hydrolase activator NlpD
MRLRLDGLTLAGLAILMLFAVNIVRGWAGEGNPALATPPAPGEGAGDTGQLATPPTPDPAQATPLPSPDMGSGQTVDAAYNEAIALPYDTYFLTQGIHGESYGHLAIDIANGNGSIIKSIINGVVSGAGYDQWGNTFIQIENDYYIVLYLHGIYTPALGETVTAGQSIGTESNIGYTLDRAGNLCAGRDCGYHTHLNVFDKRLGMNIDPLSLIPANYP